LPITHGVSHVGESDPREGVLETHQSPANRCRKNVEKFREEMHDEVSLLSG
jgi:hypothetical protein